jgi:hypothetical protein
LINVAPETVVPLIKKLMEKCPRKMLKPDVLLRKHCKPDERDERLRLTFWDEYNAATAQGKRMSLKNVIHKVCPIEVWNGYYRRNLEKVLWIITAPRDYNLSLRHIHAKGMMRLEQIMNLPIKDKEGEVDHRSVALILKTFQLVDLRVKGAILQKVQIQQQNLNMEVSSEQMQNLSQMSMEELDAMERKLDKMQRIEGKVLDAKFSDPNANPIDALEMPEVRDVVDDATLAPFKDDELVLLGKR